LVGVFGNDRAKSAQAPVQVAARDAASANTPPAISATSEAGMSRMQRCSFMVQTGRWQGWHGKEVLV
jgi:hypothetical protein